jgi:hypothetical protein
MLDHPQRMSRTPGCWCYPQWLRERFHQGWGSRLPRLLRSLWGQQVYGPDQGSRKIPPRRKILCRWAPFTFHASTDCPLSGCPRRRYHPLPVQ